MIKLLPFPSGSLEQRNKINDIKEIKAIFNYGLKESKEVIDELSAGRSTEIAASEEQRDALEKYGFIIDHGEVDSNFHKLLVSVLRNRNYRLVHSLLSVWFRNERLTNSELNH